MPVAVGDFMILDAVRESGGLAVAADESQIPHWMEHAMRTEGLPICPETAACLGALQSLRGTGQIGPDERVVIFNTGAAHKYVEVMQTELTADRSASADPLGRPGVLSVSAVSAWPRALDDLRSVTTTLWRSPMSDVTVTTRLNGPILIQGPRSCAITREPSMTCKGKRRTPCADVRSRRTSRSATVRTRPADSLLTRKLDSQRQRVQSPRIAHHRPSRGPAVTFGRPKDEGMHFLPSWLP